MSDWLHTVACLLYTSVFVGVITKLPLERSAVGDTQIRVDIDLADALRRCGPGLSLCDPTATMETEVDRERLPQGSQKPEIQFWGGVGSVSYTHLPDRVNALLLDFLPA